MQRPNYRASALIFNGKLPGETGTRAAGIWWRFRTVCRRPSCSGAAFTALQAFSRTGLDGPKPESTGEIPRTCLPPTRRVGSTLPAAGSLESINALGSDAYARFRWALACRGDTADAELLESATASSSRPKSNCVMSCPSISPTIAKRPDLATTCPFQRRGRAQSSPFHAQNRQSQRHPRGEPWRTDLRRPNFRSYFTANTLPWLGLRPEQFWYPTGYGPRVLAFWPRLL